jgi:hypothetical protein
MCREFGLESLGVKGDGRIVPVFLLHFSQERAVLIDNVHQALSQPVAVLAVQVQFAQCMAMFPCSPVLYAVSSRILAISAVVLG